ncbi:MAG: ribokinase [Methylobacteriaceae bacterium]|nr:ribokinase [Methylobacteriaceae bacterium]MBV9243423.1 ribokinase [Methylobacteriaceae bacterium]
MIVVFGSINIDLVTRVARIPAPGETVLGPSYEVIPGGKGANQALAARRAGASVALVGAVGRDGFAETALALQRAEGVDVSGVASAAAPTGAAFIAVDAGGQNAIVVAAGANAQARASQFEALAFGEGDILLLQREIPDSEAEAAAHAAKGRGGRVILNLAPSGAIPESYLHALDVLVMNEHEAAAIGTSLGLAASSPDLIAAGIAERFGLAAIVTLGAEGAIGFAAGVRSAVPALPVTVVDTTAAGDAFVGAFAAGLDRGLGFAEALARGVAAGSFACTKPGAQPSLPYAADIEVAVARIKA